jgi:hypothetical protein
VSEVEWVPVIKVADVLAYEDERNVAAKVPALLAEQQ